MHILDGPPPLIRVITCTRTTGSGHTPTDMVIEDLAAAAQAFRAEHELLVVGCILAEPLAGINVADRCGLEIDHFEQEDLRSIYISILTKCRLRRLTGDLFRDKLVVLLLARDVLKMEGFWKEPEGRGLVSGSEWSDTKLVALASMFPGISAFPFEVGQLLQAHHRLQRGARLYSELCQVLAGREAA